MKIIEPAWAKPVLQEIIFRSGFETLVANKAPIANAGTDQVIYGDSSLAVLLIGERSEDVDSKALTAVWENISDTVIPGDPPEFIFPPAVTFGAAKGLNQEYFASPFEDIGFLKFRLTVTDDNGASSSDEVNITVLSSKITATVSMQGVIPDGAQPRLFLFDPDGNLLASGSGDGITISHLLGAGVAYAVATANVPVDMTISVTLPDGTVLNSEVTPARVTSIGQTFLSAADLENNLPNLLVLGYQPVTEGEQPIRAYEHPQIIEITLQHPDPGLREPNRFLSYLNQTSIRYQEDTASAEAYYRAVDPNNIRTNLDDWLLITGFTAAGDGATATYQNDADLGFGREMHMRENVGGTASAYVRNFPSLDHALANEKLIATVAMEYGFTVEHPARYTSFFAFGPDGERLLEVDLDGRGAKTIPGVCNVCHGGSPKPTFVDGSGIVTYPDQGDTNAQFLPWDLDTFVFSSEPGLSRAEQEKAFFDLNQLAKATFPSVPGDITGVNWTGAVSTDLINGWYADGQVFNGTVVFVPSGWAADPEHKALYLDVVAPNCRACHVTRGTAEQDVIDFSTYDKFLAYAPLIDELVFQQGVMPLASRTFGHFWRGAQNSPATKLAAWLEGLSATRYPRVQANGDALKPGRPQSRTGMIIDGPEHLTIVQNDPKGTLLDGRNSLFATHQDRRVVTLVPIFGEDTTEFGPQAITKPGPGDPGNILRYARQIVAPASVSRTLFGRGELNQPNFLGIEDLFSDQCKGCHNASFPNIPVRFDDINPLLVYREVLDRINFEQPSQSLILTKPGGLRHGLNDDPSRLFDSPVSNWDYFDGVDGDIRNFDSMGSAAQKVVQWIQAGAPFSTNSLSWNCQNVGLPIPDNDANGLTDLVFFGPAQIGRDFQVDMQLQHTSLNDLEISLTHLDTGATSVLVNRPTGQGGASCDRQDINVTFWSLPAVPPSNDLCNVAPAVSIVQPHTSLIVFDQIPVSGRWQLTVKDLSAGETGTLKQWCLRNR